MFDFLGKYKKLGLIFIVSIFVFVVLKNFTGTNTNQDDLLVSSGPAKSDISRDFVALLFQLSLLKLDNSLFKDELFKSLQDFGLEISPQPYGKDNPFAPLDGVNLTILTNVLTNTILSTSTERRI